MKQKRTFLLLSVVVAVLVMAIGYAAVSNINLRVSGAAQATPDQGNFKIAFTGTPSITKKGNATCTAQLTGDTSAVLNITGLSTSGDEAIATFTVKNSSPDISAYVDYWVDGHDNGRRDGFVTVSWKTGRSNSWSVANDGWSGDITGFELAPGQSETIQVKVTCDRDLIDNYSNAFTVKMVAEPISDNEYWS